MPAKYSGLASSLLATLDVAGCEGSNQCHATRRAGCQLESGAGGSTGKPGNAAAGEAKSAGWFSGDWGKKFYEGGFETEMTKQEAAKILGIRYAQILEGYNILM